MMANLGPIVVDRFAIIVVVLYYFLVERFLFVATGKMLRLTFVYWFSYQTAPRYNKH